MALYQGNKLLSGVVINKDATSAFQAAQAGGYQGTEEEFNEFLANAEEMIGDSVTDAKAYTDEQIALIPAPDVSGEINAHDTDADAHGDIRVLVTELTTRLNALANSDDATLDQMAEVVSYIKNNKSLIDGITTNKINVSDVINNLTTNVSNKPLSAAQGVALKALIDAIVVPSKTSQLTNDSGFITGFTETDPTVPAWAKSSSKPSYTASEVGAAEATHGHSAGDITSGTLPVARGGTGVTALEGNGLMMALHPNVGVTDFIATIGQGYCGNGFCTPTQLATAMGAAKVQVGYYVGTNTYGASNALSLTFSFAPKIIILREFHSGTSTFFDPVFPEMLTTNYAAYVSFWNVTGAYAKKSADGKTITWYGDTARYQCNENARTYHWIAIG